MSSDNNVIDFAAAQKKRKNKKASGSPVKASLEKNDVVDMTERRNAILSQERREVRRTILTEFVGAFTIVPGKGLLKVALYDISEDGLAFDIEKDDGSFASNEEVAMRVYLNQYTFFPFVASVKNIRFIEDEGVYRVGCHFKKGTVNDEALFHFVKFIETVSASLKTDGGDVMVSNLKK